MKTLFVCVPGDNFSGRFLDCWTGFIFQLQCSGWTVTISRNYSPVVAVSRLRCVGGSPSRGQFQTPFNGADYDFILWIDSDMIWNYENFLGLYYSIEAGNYDIMSGLYLTANCKGFACAREWQPEKLDGDGVMDFLKPCEIEDDIDPIQVAYNGFGFMLIRKGVLERLPYPWFCSRPPNEKLVPISEDVDFALCCADAGIKIMIDPCVVVGHEKRMVLRP